MNYESLIIPHLECMRKNKTFESSCQTSFQRSWQITSISQAAQIIHIGYAYTYASSIPVKNLSLHVMDIL